jgi:hypothetical protein
VYVQVQVSDQPLTAFGLRDDGAVLGCGTADGCCSVMQLSSVLVDMVSTEKQTVNAMFERETLRCGVSSQQDRVQVSKWPTSRHMPFRMLCVHRAVAALQDHPTNVRTL